MPKSIPESERIEFSLDNRQVLFLLFALLVIGSFVFLMGFLVGRRSEGLSAAQWSNQGVVAANIGGDADFDDEPFPGDDEAFAFEKGVAVNDAAKLPPTRPEGTAPRDEQQVRAERYQKDLAKVQATTPPKKTPRALAPFTLQIRRFTDRAAADLLAQRIRRKGFHPKVELVTSGEFLVTVGSYVSWNDALDAKSAFEEKVGLVAYAARQ